MPTEAPLMEMFVQYALAPCVVGLFLLIGWLLAKAAQKFASDGKANAVMAVLGRVFHVVEAVVLEMKQTVVDEVKAASMDGKITKEEREKILKAALDKVKAYLGANGLAELHKIVGITPTKLDDYLITLIEGFVVKFGMMSRPQILPETTPFGQVPPLGQRVANVLKKSP